jgi:hypothetical protein
LRMLALPRALLRRATMSAPPLLPPP